jgi:hypothetical protein
MDLPPVEVLHTGCRFPPQHRFPLILQAFPRGKPNRQKTAVEFFDRSAFSPGADFVAKAP